MQPLDEKQTEAADLSPGPGNTAGPQFRKVVLPPKLARKGRKPILPRVFLVSEAAAILRVSHCLIYEMLKDGRLQGFKSNGRKDGKWRITDLAIMAFMGYPSPGYPIPKRLPSPGRRQHLGNYFFERMRANAETPEEGDRAVAAYCRERNTASRGKSMGRRTLVLSQDSGAGGSRAEGS